ncbi:MAG: winged helix-turn-helix transcriptional regulator [Bacteroidales bacterium]|nr:winged helix-turn-helix transcriptional regulator [Bacteroidales bacterium]
MISIEKIKRIDFEKEGQVFKALGNPLRLKMVSLLMNDECCVTDITNTLGISQSTSSQHLNILKNSGIVSPKRYGTKICYAIENEEVKQLILMLIEKYNKE